MYVFEGWKNVFQIPKVPKFFTSIWSLHFANFPYFTALFKLGPSYH